MPCVKTNNIVQAGCFYLSRRRRRSISLGIQRTLSHTHSPAAWTVQKGWGHISTAPSPPLLAILKTPAAPRSSPSEWGKLFAFLPVQPPPPLTTALHCLSSSLTTSSSCFYSLAWLTILLWLLGGWMWLFHVGWIDLFALLTSIEFLVARCELGCALLRLPSV